MARRAQLRHDLKSADGLERRYRAARESQEGSWWQIVWLLMCG
jgi:hypothetical protein